MKGGGGASKRKHRPGKRALSVYQNEDDEGRTSIWGTTKIDTVRGRVFFSGSQSLRGKNWVLVHLALLGGGDLDLS